LNLHETYIEPTQCSASIKRHTIPIALGQTTDNSLGTWKLNMEKSKFSPSAPVKSLTATREATNDGVKVTTTGERAMARRLMAATQPSMTAKNIPLLEPHTTASPLDR
jgi:hypothetical protein